MLASVENLGHYLGYKLKQIVEIITTVVGRMCQKISIHFNLFQVPKPQATCHFETQTGQKEKEHAHTSCVSTLSPGTNELGVFAPYPPITVVFSPRVALRQRSFKIGLLDTATPGYM